MSHIAAPTPPMITARFHGGPQTPRAIVMHGTVSPCKPGNARAVANWWHGPTSPVTSAHYIADPSESVQCVPDHNIAYHCGYNSGSIGYEMSDLEVGPPARWSDPAHVAMLKIVVADVARLCLAYNIEARRPTIDELVTKGPHGIYGHNDSRLAFGHTTHTDPVGFPWDLFINAVRAEINELINGSPSTPPPAKPATAGPNVEAAIDKLRQAKTNSAGHPKRVNVLQQVINTLKGLRR